jgi:anti-sigma factor ChrR (cupin superfamily)
MNTSTKEQRAAEYALGGLDGKGRRAVEADCAEDGELRDLVAAWEGRLASLEDATPPSAPPAGLLARVEAQIAGSGPAPEGTLTLRAGDGEWQPIGDGVDRKTLWVDAARGREAILMRLAAGARYAGHAHGALELCYVLEGDLEFGDHRLNAGDFHVATAQSQHPEATTTAGCLLLLEIAA